LAGTARREQNLPTHGEGLRHKRTVGQFEYDNRRFQVRRRVRHKQKNAPPVQFRADGATPISLRLSVTSPFSEGDGWVYAG
jgi:hypothetical protein